MPTAILHPIADGSITSPAGFEFRIKAFRELLHPCLETELAPRGFDSFLGNGPVEKS